MHSTAEPDIATAPAPDPTGPRPSELTARGTLFMRSSLYQQRTSAGDQQLLFPLLERRGRSCQTVVATWVGPDADAFFKTFGPSIKPGTALHFEFARIYCHNNEQHAVVQSCHLASARWATKHADDTASADTADTADTAH
jgi:hypothetical protein